MCVSVCLTDTGLCAHPGVLNYQYLSLSLHLCDEFGFRQFSVFLYVVFRQTMYFRSAVIVCIKISFGIYNMIRFEVLRELKN